MLLGSVDVNRKCDRDPLLVCSKGFEPFIWSSIFSFTWSIPNPRSVTCKLGIWWFASPTYRILSAFILKSWRWDIKSHTTKTQVSHSKKSDDSRCFLKSYFNVDEYLQGRLKPLGFRNVQEKDAPGKGCSKLQRATLAAPYSRPTGAVDSERNEETLGEPPRIKIIRIIDQTSQSFYHW